MVDMMPDDIPHADDKAKRKIHPRAKDCLRISLIPAGLLACGFVLTSFDYPDVLYAVRTYGMALFYTSLVSQPFGVLLGIYSLVQIRKDRSYSGTGYAVAGIIISLISIIACQPLFR